MEEAVKARTSAKGWLTRAERKIIQLLKRTDGVSKTEVMVVIEQFNEKLHIFDAKQSDVEDCFENLEDLEKGIEIVANFRDDVLETLIKGKELLNSLNNPDMDSSDSNSIKSKTVNARLPKIELESFSGDVTQWRTFFDQYSAIIHNSGQPDISKFTYLRSLLKGEALKAIDGLSLTSENYHSAMNILEKRFGRTECIVFGHIQKLLSLSSKSSSNLWTLYDEIQTHVRSLQNLGITGQQYGVILTPIILHQLPNNIRLEWARDGENHEGDLDFLLSFLFDEIRRRERSQTFGPMQPPTRDHHQQHERRRSATAALLGQSSVNKKCVFCEEHHYSDKCTVIKDLSLEKRRDLLRQKGLCFVCLGRHLAKDCTKNCFKCRGKHNIILCKINNQRAESVSSVEHDTSHQGMVYANCKGKRTIMQVVKTEINGKKVNVMFDSGADRSFVTTSCANKLNLHAMGREKITVSCFGEEKSPRQGEQRKLYRLSAFGKSMNLLEIPSVCCDMFRCAVPDVVLRDFANIPFEENFGEDCLTSIDILIGLDLYWDLIGNEYIRFKGLVAQKTIFGWMLSGQYTHERGNVWSERTHSFFCHCEIAEDAIRRLWDLDGIGITDTSIDKPVTDTLADFKNKITFDNDRYEVKLPWKNEEMKNHLIDNRDEAKKRLENLNKRLERDPDLQTKYNDVLHDLESRGIVHEVPEDEINREGPIFYLPHRPVVREDSLTTKIRPVFDASAKGKNGISLNDCMETGPNLIPDLLKMLIRFRRWQFALTGDITKAFLQIKVEKKDQNVHRFLWDVNGQTRHMRFDRVVFGNTCSPYLLNATLKHHLSQFEETTAVKELKSSLYVDDWLTGTDKEEDLVALMSEAENILKTGGFPMTKWASNSNLVTDTLNKTFTGYEEMPPTKILGICWKTKEDSFCFETLGSNMSEEQDFTKRRLLSLIARIFDPLGLLTPYTVTLKILFQEIWRQGLDWDQPLPEQSQRAVLKWIQGLQQIREWKIPRRLTNIAWLDVEHMELIAFSDASEKAYGCCIYLKTICGNQNQISLVMSKVKVAPLKKVTLPRLELLAALLAARLLRYVATSLGLTTDLKYTCWSDSQIALNWIKSDPNRWKQFIRNRVVEIQELTNPSHWRFCPGETNPADLLTRGVCAKTLLTSPKWLYGPDWLNHHQDLCDGDTNIEDKSEILPVKKQEIMEGPKWLANPDEGTNELEDQIDMEEQKTISSSVACDTTMNSLMDFNRVGSWKKLLRIVGWIIRFVSNCRTCKSDNNKTMTKNLTQDEINHARKKIMEYIQRKTYNDELNRLERGLLVEKHSPISNLSPFIGEDNLLRIKGRLDFAPGLYYEEKHPIILPKCHISYLIAKSHHETLKHAGVNTMITALRNKFWIVGVRTIVKKICRRCVRCQRQNSRPMDQVTAPLPEDRLTRSPPFHVTGVDHAGPLYCADINSKLYILIFTCAVTRAVHLELVNSLSLDEFLRAFRRFSARRGLPTIIYSDNAKTFKGADQYIHKYFPLANITWKFNAPRAPWWGGWWERLIRSVKAGLRKSLGLESVARSELETVLHEVESCINSRPLTYVEETKQALTPSHFLIGRGTPLVSSEPIEFCSEMMDLRKREEEIRKAVNSFWDIWINEYLRNLPPLCVKKKNTNLKVGAVVLIKAESKSRLMWPLGIITKLYNGKDGLVRAVQLKTAKGLIDRPIQNLLWLEIEVDGWNEVSSPIEEEEEARGVIENTAEVVDKKITRRGRVIKPRKILDL